MSKLIDYSYMKYSSTPELFISDNERRINSLLIKNLNDAELIIAGYKDTLDDAENRANEAEERAAQAEDALNDIRDAVGIMSAEGQKVRGALETLQLATNKWTYDIILATTLLLCILAFTYMIMIYNEYQSELCLY